MKRKLLLLFLLFGLKNLAQQNINANFDFGPVPVTKNYVYASGVHTDGKLLLAGDLNEHDGKSCNQLIKLNADGSRDTSFSAPYFAGTIFSFAVLNDGKILVGGDYTGVNGYTTGRICRLNANGTVDYTFNPGSNGLTTASGFNGRVKKIKVLNNGNILVGGDFTSYNNITGINRYVQLTSNGAVESSFNAGTGFNNGVYDIAVQTNGKILVAGAFTNYNNTSVKNMVSLETNGTLDSSFNNNVTGFFNSVNVIEIQPNDNKIIIGGNFTDINGNSSNNYVARLNTNGSLDNTFTCTGINGPVNSLALQADDKILIGGTFTGFSSNFYGRLARLNTNGTPDTSFINANITDNVNTILLTNNKIVAGTFGYVYLNNDGSKDTNYRNYAGFNSYVNTNIFQNDGKLLVGGFFTQYKNKTQNRLIRFNSDLSVDTGFNIGTGFNDQVKVIAVQPDNKILVGGNFNSYNNVNCGRIVRLNADGTLDNTFNGININWNVYDIKVLSNEEILVCGDGGVKKLSKFGAIDAGFNASTITMGITMHVQNTGKILVGGYISSVGHNLVRLNPDGTSDSTFQGSGFDNLINTITPLANGKLAIGGLFTKFNTTTQSKIAILNADGTLDNSFTSANIMGEVKCITELANGKLLVGGTLFAVNGSSVNRIVLFNTNGSLSTDVSFGTGISSSSPKVNSFAVRNNEVIMGGDFTSYKTTTSAHLTRLDFNSYLSVEENELPNNSYTIYPNPATDILTITTDESFDYAIGKIFNMNGALISQNKLSETINTVNIASLAKGVYILKIETNKGFYTKRVIKN